jgi:hypothetical protein
MIISTNDRPLDGLRGMDSALCGVSLDIRKIHSLNYRFLNNFLFSSCRRYQLLKKDWYDLYVFESLDKTIFCDYDPEFPGGHNVCVRRFNYWNIGPILLVERGGERISITFRIKNMLGIVLQYFKRMKNAS